MIHLEHDISGLLVLQGVYWQLQVRLPPHGVLVWELELVDDDMGREDEQDVKRAFVRYSRVDVYEDFRV